LTQGAMHRKQVIITGATSGIGRATAQELAARGARVVIVGRNVERLEGTRESIIRTTGNSEVVTVKGDLSSMEQVRGVARDILALCPRVNVLINNAGGIFGRREETVDGYERTLALDHLSPYLLTSLLMDRLVVSAPSRVVTVSSSAHWGGNIDLDDLMMERQYSAFRAYAQAKLANVMFTYELARRLEGTAVTANCLHPGVVRTRFGIEAGRLVEVGSVLIRPFEISATRGARTSIYLASSPEVEGVTGKYFAGMRQRRSSSRSYDVDLARRLWEVSAELTGLG
jgi:retinol dehydrogenase 14